MLVDGEHVDAPRGQGLLSAVRHAVGLRDDSTLTRRNDVLPVGIDAHAQHARIVMPFEEKKEKKKKREMTRGGQSRGCARSIPRNLLSSSWSCVPGRPARMYYQKRIGMKDGRTDGAYLSCEV